MLQLEHVAIRYDEGPEVLRDVNLTLRRGEFVYLTGPSGAGKTSLLRVLALLQIPSAGRLTMFGDDVAQLGGDRRAALRRRIGVVFQDVRLLDHLSALDNVALPLRINGGRDEQIRTCVSDMLKWLGLGNVIGARPPVLSMGQRQLVSVARAVITRPSLLLCDEPSNGKVQDAPAGDEQREARAGGQQGGDLGRRRHDMLEVVEDQQQPPHAQMLAAGLAQGRAAAIPGDPSAPATAGRREQGRGGGEGRRRQTPSGVRASYLRRDLEREPRLADATGAGQGHQADVSGEQGGGRGGSRSRPMRGVSGTGRCACGAERATTPVPIT